MIKHKIRHLCFQFKIRQIALLGLGQLYKAIMYTEDVSQAHISKVLWVKDKIFHAYYQQNPDDRYVSLLQYWSFLN